MNYHISLKKNIKSIFDFIYNLFKLEFKIFKEYIQDKFKKEFIYSFILSFDSLILFIKKFNDNLYFYINNALCEFLNEFYIIYLDNILIYIDDSLEDYINHVYQVF